MHGRSTRLVYPYSHPWKWWFNNRFRHLVDGLQEAPHLGLIEQAILQQRTRLMNKWLIVRAFLMPFLFASVISAVAVAVVGAIGATSETSAALSLFRTVSNTFAGVFLAAYFLANRTLGQVESDILLLLTVGASKPLESADS